MHDDGYKFLAAVQRDLGPALPELPAKLIIKAIKSDDLVRDYFRLQGPRASTR